MLFNGRKQNPDDPQHNKEANMNIQRHEEKNIIVESKK